MTIPFSQARLATRLAQTADDLALCQALRHQCFFGAAGLDDDGHDTGRDHLMVTDQSGRLVATSRLFWLRDGRDIEMSVTAQSYDLQGLSRSVRPMLEVGRFCVAPGTGKADVLRVAWAALTRLVDARDVSLLFGCTSFQGVDPHPYGGAFARLLARHQGPRDLQPRPRAPEVIPLGSVSAKGTAPLPALLRTYLAMGGWVGNHAVVDRQMQTLHVFTCVDVAAVPPARARALRALAQVTALA